MARHSESLGRWVGRAVVLGCGALALLAPRTSAAFKEPGHRAIERLAYETLVSSGHSEVLARLVKAGALRGVLPRLPQHVCAKDKAPGDAKDKAPGDAKESACEVPDDPGADPNDYIGLPEGDLNVHGVWVGSHMPDHEFNRQFQPYGQCFHFNARGADARTPTFEKSGVPVGLSRDAYLRCMSLMDIMIRGILADTADANARHVGLYNLIHMVTDSFSEAHVARQFSKKFDDGTHDWSIVYVKPWRLRTWLPNLIYWGGWETFVTDTHHGIFDDRDYDYLAPGCEDFKKDAEEKIGALTKNCLSARAQRAADAVVDLLILVSAYIEFPDAPKGGAIDLPGFEKEWRKYRKEHFRHAFVEHSAIVEEGDSDPDTENLVSRSTAIQETQSEALGVGLAFDVMSTRENIWLEGNVFYGKDSMAAESIGLSDAITHTVQLRLPFETDDGQRPLAVAYELGFRVPGDLLQSDFLSLQFGAHLLRGGAGVSRVGATDTRYIFEGGFGGLSLDLILKQRVWLGVTGPRVVWRWDTWGPDDAPRPDVYWSMKTGVAFGSN